MWPAHRKQPSFVSWGVTAVSATVQHGWMICLSHCNAALFIVSQMSCLCRLPAALSLCIVFQTGRGSSPALMASWSSS